MDPGSDDIDAAAILQFRFANESTPLSLPPTFSESQADRLFVRMLHSGHVFRTDSTASSAPADGTVDMMPLGNFDQWLDEILPSVNEMVQSCNEAL